MNVNPGFSKSVKSVVSLSYAVLFASALGATEVVAAPTFYSTSDAAQWSVSTNLSLNDATASEASLFKTDAADFSQAVAITGRFSEGVSWIANNATGTNGCCIGSWTQFVFRQTFDLTGYDATSANLQFRWGGDDTGQVFSSRGSWTPKFKLNGGSFVDGTAGYYVLGNTVTLNSGFVAGLNTIDFYVQGNGVTDGFVLQSVGFTAQPVPEPETYALMLAGLGLLGVAARRRKQKQTA